LFNIIFKTDFAMQKYINMLIFKLIFSFLFSSYADAQNPDSISLSGKWKVVWNDGNKGTVNELMYLSYNPKSDTLRYVTVDVPMDLNLAMSKRGMFGDINYGTNTPAAS
jgi:hypothetical protein